MMDVAVLLNLTDQLSFEVADPLMSVINAGTPLLFYDRLSVMPFPSDETKCQEHVERLVSSMRNMLEARSLSTEDDNERIRVIVTMNLSGGAFQPEGPSLMFPAQKVRQFIRTIEDIFNPGNQFLDRFEYVFIFLAGQTSQDTFYQSLAYDGITGGSSLKWFSKDDVDLNQVRDDIFQKLDTPNDEWPLTHEKVKAAYSQFKDRLGEVVNTISSQMAQAGLGEEFRELIWNKFTNIENVADFSNFDYDQAIISLVAQMIGLCSNEFNRNCSFFIIRTDSTTIGMRLKCQTYIASLVQFLSTISDNDYNRLLKANAINSSARVFIMSSLPDSDCMDTDVLATLKKMVKDCNPYLETARWKYDQKVSYISYSLRAEDPVTVDPYYHINDKFAQQRQYLFDNFNEIRKVPFFFGKSIGDWSWYKRVLKCAVDLFHFEEVNDRPLYDVPRRITDNEMEQEQIDSTYTELENAVNILSKEQPEVKKGPDLNVYLKERSKLMDNFGETIEKLKAEMVKLGYFTCLLWIGILSTLGFTLTYAYHFIGYGVKDNPMLIVACCVLVSLLFVISAVIGRARVKSKIETVYSEMDSCYNKLQSNLKDHLDGIALRIKLQNEADIRRKNLDEMKSKLEAFFRHNKQVDLWIKHYEDITTKLSANVNSEDTTSYSFNERDFDLENCMPSLPYAIISKFGQLTVKFTVTETNINNVTSFVRHFKFVEEGQN